MIEAADLPWMGELGVRRYPAEFDIEAGVAWLRDYVIPQPEWFLGIRTDNAFLVTMISAIPWSPTKPEANAVMCCAEEGKPWEVMRLIRVSLFWAKRRGCAEWRWRTATEFNIDAMARRIGARELPPCYAVRL